MSGKGTYETFDSGAGPTVYEPGSYAKEDGGGDPKNSVEDLAVPTMPQEKK